MTDKIHLGNERPTSDAWGKLVSGIYFNNQFEEITFTLEKENKVQTVKITYQQALAIGLINLEPLDIFFKKM